MKVKLQTGEQGLCCCGFFRTVMMGVWELSQEHCRDSVARLCPKVRIPVCLCNKLDVSSQHNIDTLGNNRVALVATFKMACTLDLNSPCSFNKAGAHLRKPGMCKVIRIQACRSPINRILPLFKILHCLLCLKLEEADFEYQ